LARISESVQSFGVYESTGARRCVLDRFLYSIFFLERRDKVWVLAVAHTARKPGYWKNRLSDQA
jgi:toxin ParE1/3/4